MIIPAIIIIITATCWIIYELLLSTVTSYLLWNSIEQFSITIWFFLFWLGIWSFLAKFVKNYQKTFIITETLLAIIWWLSIIIVKWVYLYLIQYVLVFKLIYIWFVSLIWILVWLEIPLIWIFLNEKYRNFQTTIGNLLSLDYIWSLIWTIIFPIILLPRLWLTYTAIIIWILNLTVSIIFLTISNLKTKEKIKFLLVNLIGLTFLISVSIFSLNKLEHLWDHFFYEEPIIYSHRSKYQYIVITQRWNDIRLYLDWHLQFLSLDEHRYHLSLTYFAKKYIDQFSWNNLKILILWWGDGLATRNILEYLSWKHINYNITLVDLDPEITNLAKNFYLLKKLNKNSLNNPHVKIINQDAFNFLLNNKNKYNIIIADFPDPRNIQIAKLYSKEFYWLILNHLTENGIFTTQASNSFFAKEAFWDIYKTLEYTTSKIKKDDYKVVPYHTYIPSFWDWWFVTILLWKSTNLYNWHKIAFSWLVNFNFDKDYIVNLKNLKINSIENPIIVKYYLEGYKRFSN